MAQRRDIVVRCLVIDAALALLPDQLREELNYRFPLPQQAGQMTSLSLHPQICNIRMRPDHMISSREFPGSTHVEAPALDTGELLDWVIAPEAALVDEAGVAQAHDRLLFDRPLSQQEAPHAPRVRGFPLLSPGSGPEFPWPCPSAMPWW